MEQQALVPHLHFALAAAQFRVGDLLHPLDPAARAEKEVRDEILEWRALDRRAGVNKLRVLAALRREVRTEVRERPARGQPRRRRLDVGVVGKLGQESD